MSERRCQTHREEDRQQRPKGGGRGPRREETAEAHSGGRETCRPCLEGQGG